MLTVIVPNFNHSRFLGQALGALAGQTRPPDEVIVIDDASTDDSVKVIEAWLPKLPNARLLRNQTNLGVVRNMNIGLELARGSDIAFVAADDVIYPEFFKTILALLERHPQAAFASSRTDIIDAAGAWVARLNAPVPLAEAGFIDARTAAAQLMYDDAWFTGNATVFRRACLLEVGGFPEELAAFTDGYISRLLAVRYGSCFTPEVLAAWRYMEGGIAWTYANDVVRACRIADLAEARLRENGDLFAAGYPERWKSRYIFGANRAALAQARRLAKSESPARFARALLREIIGCVWLFMTLRPRDTVPVLRRRLNRQR